MSFKERLSNFGTYVVAIIILTGIFFLALGIGGKTGKIHSQFLIIGFLILSSMGLIIYLGLKKITRDLHNSNKKIDSQIEKLKKSAIQIKVNLENLEIKSNSWTDSLPVRSSHEHGLDEAFGTGDRNQLNITRHMNTIIFKIPYKGNVIERHVDIEMDNTTLLLHLMLKKETIFYVNPKDTENNYLDLEFLTRR